MKEKEAYVVIREDTKRLLEGSEGFDVDFKRNPEAVVSEDIVAFANSENGGTILIGVDEFNGHNEMQRGIIVGSEIGDQIKLGLLDKAFTCSPSVNIEITFENVNSSKPIIRIDIPSSDKKPHCTPKGVYKVRGDGKNEPILPDKLLEYFINENNELDIEDRLEKIEKKIDDILKKIK